MASAVTISRMLPRIAGATATGTIGFSSFSCFLQATSDTPTSATMPNRNVVRMATSFR